MAAKFTDFVAETYHESRRHKSRESATQIMKVDDVICVADFHDLCRPRQGGDFVAKLA